MGNLRYRQAIIGALFVAFGLFLSALFALEPKFKVENLSWLHGCWVSNSEGTAITEQWMKPAGGTMLGMSRTISNNKTVEFEFLCIRQDEGGDIHFIANPSGQKEASFKMSKGGAQEVIFENPDHDFPQKITYRLEKEGSLAARIEGKSKGTPKAVDFLMKKVPCD